MTTDAIDTTTEATETTETPAAPEPSLEESMLSAMDEGLEQDAPTSDAGDAPAEKAEAADEDVKSDDTDDTEDDQGDAKAEETNKAPDADKEVEQEPERDEATEKEISELGLKDKTAARFRELATSAKEYAPVREAMEAAGIQSAEDIQGLSQRSKDFEDMVSMVQDTGATPEQYGQALDMVKLINGAMSGDRQSAENAYKFMQAEVAGLAKMLGKEVDGFDPLAEHADLQREVDNGDLSRERALEIVQTRNGSKMDSQRTQEMQQQQSQKQAQADGVQALNTLGNQLEAQDPQYRAKLPYLISSLETIKASLPPEQWVAATQQAYARIPAPPAQPKPKAKPAPGPVRSGAMRQALEPTTDDPMEALDLGIKAVG